MSAPLIRLSRVTFGYAGHEPVLDKLDFALHSGERVGLMGDIGAGKTTLLHLIVGLITPTAGEIEAFGRVREQEADFHEVRQAAGLLFQDPEDQLFCPTVIEDVAFGPLNLGKTRGDAVDLARRTLASVGMEGYEDRVCYRLSGGEKRLVSLAAVLAMEPQALLLDEPFSGLDEAHVERVMAILEGLPQSMVIVSHQREHLHRLASRTARLERGRIVDA